MAADLVQPWHVVAGFVRPRQIQWRTRRITLEDVFAKAKQGEIKQINLLVKADVSGSLEAIEKEIANYLCYEN